MNAYPLIKNAISKSGISLDEKEQLLAIAEKELLNIDMTLQGEEEKIVQCVTERINEIRAKLKMNIVNQLRETLGQNGRVAGV